MGMSITGRGWYLRSNYIYMRQQWTQYNHVWLSACLYFCVSLCLFICLSLCLFVRLSVCLFIRLSVSLSDFLSFHPPACVIVRLSACPSVRISVFLHVPYFSLTYLPFCLFLSVRRSCACLSVYMIQCMSKFRQYPYYDQFIEVNVHPRSCPCQFKVSI